MTSAGCGRMTGTCGMRNGAGTRSPSSGGGSGCGYRLMGGSLAATGFSEIARDLRITPGSVRSWHRAWRDGGDEALRSKGRCRCGEAEPAAVGPAGRPRNQRR